jgi:two-component system CheB/CheR fusion protein
VAEFETVFRCKSGDIRACLISGEIIQLQSGPHFLSVIRDVTQQRLAEEQARRWQQVFEKAEFALAHTSVANNTFLAVNPACAKERGYTPEELAGQPITLIYPPEVLPVMRERMSSVDADGHMVFESIHQRKDGSTFPVLV